MKPATGKTICLVLERYCEWLQEQSSKTREHAALLINGHLDALRASGDFGTDGRRDPRGA